MRDLESNEQYNSSDLALTAQALAQVRSWASANGEQLTISYTIPVLPTGFTSTGESILTTALANGFTPNIVNIMTMDYGTSGTEMGAAANQALDAVASQLETLADATTVESYAAQQGIAWLSFWAEGRDNDGCPGSTTASSTCSGISQSNGAFTAAFQSFTSGSSGGGGSPTPTPTPTPTSTTSASCAPAWVNNTAYVSGNQASYNGSNWTASQWNYDDVPGGPIFPNGPWPAPAARTCC